MAEWRKLTEWHLERTSLHSDICDWETRESGYSRTLPIAPCLVKWCSLVKLVLVPLTPVGLLSRCCFANISGCFHVSKYENGFTLLATPWTSCRCNYSDQLCLTSSSHTKCCMSLGKLCCNPQFLFAIFEGRNYCLFIFVIPLLGIANVKHWPILKYVEAWVPLYASSWFCLVP